MAELTWLCLLLTTSAEPFLMSLRHQLSLVVSFQRRYGCCTVAGGDRLCGPGVDLILNTFRPFKAWVMSRSSGGHGLADTCTLFRLETVHWIKYCAFTRMSGSLTLDLVTSQEGGPPERKVNFDLCNFAYSEKICHFHEVKLSTKMYFMRRLAEHLAFICFPSSVLITRFGVFPGSASKYPSQHIKKSKSTN